MTTRRGPQYSIQSDEGRLRSRNDTTNGKRKDKILNGKEYTKGSAISQREVPEIPFICDPEFELSIIHSKKDKLHSHGSDRNVHYSVKTVFHNLQRQRLENSATNSPRSDEVLPHPQKFPKGGANIKILQWMESTIIQTSNQKKNYWDNKKREGRKEEAPVASTIKPQAR
ncbi:hypothetical protein O181_074681 [Austropuccinia psidii MF-1]|uniref:Uncharacterized protein n=1 Tax=Austropuccinia psidii MF-1 TaxID=1389203 RepID=A0A9Q3FDA6_9BASI|nr:hypothetical protein [Austropuccinia psidii MF-1]